MICTKCGAQVRDGVKFCPNCGAKQDGAATAPAQQPAGAQPYQQQPYQQQGYQQPQQPQQVVTYAQQAQAYGEAGRPIDNGAKTLGLVGMICGIAGLVFDFIFFPIGVILSIVGIVASGMAMSRNKGGSNGMAIAGLICGIIGLLLGLPLCICGAALCSAGTAAVSSGGEAAEGLRSLVDMLNNL